ncbi:MAG TPA: D-glycerate dehydrogenase [Solirubrobacteraceae bacterium]|nr:D-glycerate dehydrogenase [Solirubrobacteraceae bacterium]
MALVVVTRAVPGDALERLARAHDVKLWPGDEPPSADELRELVLPAAGLLCMLTDRVDAGLLDAAPGLRAIANYAIGSDNIDLAATAARGIPVGVTPDVLTDATADVAMALLLAVARRLPQASAAVRSGGWRTWSPTGWLGLELRGARLLVVGPGRIGRATADRAAAFGMEVAFAGRDDDLPSLLAHADVVSLHAPLTPQTHHLIDAGAIAAMKPGAILVNTARGGLVDQVALRRALVDGHLGGAGLDVTDPEPLAPDDPLLEAPNLLVLPHIGSATHTARRAMADLSVDNLLAALDGRPMPHPAATRARGEP